MAATQTTWSLNGRKAESAAVVLFVILNLVAPWIVGEMYPFTVSPMFRDQPEQYCTYQLFDGEGNELDLEPYGLHLVYDGNPPGLGMGIEANPTLHKFGEVPELNEVADHVRQVLALRKKPGSVRLLQSVVCCNGTCPETEVRETNISLDSVDGD